MDERTIVESWWDEENIQEITIREEDILNKKDRLSLKIFRNCKIVEELPAKRWRMRCLYCRRKVARGCF